jgi:predicted  nucleic acid-binding Zn-ribbon protein
MSVVSKLKKSRATWKTKAVERNSELKYQRAEVKRLKGDRNKYKAQLQDMKRQLAEEQKKTACRLLKIKNG